MEVSKEQLKGYVESILLSELSKKDNYGYEISKEIKRLSDSKFQIKEGTLYVVLKRLEQKGYVESYWKDGMENSAGKRKYYKITSIGKRYLKEKSEEWILLKKIMDTFYGGAVYE
jgi:PadR family transcriptional regulator PadR